MKKEAAEKKAVVEFLKKAGQAVCASPSQALLKRGYHLLDHKNMKF